MQIIAGLSQVLVAKQFNMPATPDLELALYGRYAMPKRLQDVGFELS